jgi:hypothetical protein
VGEFLKGWRRKLGLMMLVLAFVLTGMWVRSHVADDVYSWPLGDFRALTVTVTRNWISFGRWSTFDEAGLNTFWPMEQLYFPYSVVIMPRLLFSAWLLLTNPRTTANPESSADDSVRILENWRRTIGKVSLIVALVFSVGWTRSLYIRDVVVFRQGLSTIGFRSYEGELGLERFSSSTSLNMPNNTGWHAEYARKHFSLDTWWGFDNFNDDEIDWRWDWAGFSFGEASKKEPPLLRRNLELWIVPYSSIIFPLALISFWLLLSKPRKSNQKKIPEPTSVEGT